MALKFCVGWNYYFFKNEVTEGLLKHKWQISLTEECIQTHCTLAHILHRNTSIKTEFSINVKSTDPLNHIFSWIRWTVGYMNIIITRKQCHQDALWENKMMKATIWFVQYSAEETLLHNTNFNISVNQVYTHFDNYVLW